MNESISVVNVESVFNQLGGIENGGWPVFDSRPQRTPGGVSYFQGPGVALLSKPQTNVMNMKKFIDGFDHSLGFHDYLNEDDISLLTGSEGLPKIHEGTRVVKLAGQLCYLSLGPNRTRNNRAQSYIDNILSSGHGSVLEHAQYTWIIWGADRSFTHELVRHRSGVAFSQVSQRYVDGKTLRFVERPEWQSDAALHTRFERRVEGATNEYNELAAALMERQALGDVALSSEKKTVMRKKVNQAARSSLPNETEAPIIMSGNIRALRHVMEMRAAGAADVPIREVTTRLFLGMAKIEPLLYNDYTLGRLPDGTFTVQTLWRKV